MLLTDLTPKNETIEAANSHISFDCPRCLGTGAPHRIIVPVLATIKGAWTKVGSVFGSMSLTPTAELEVSENPLFCEAHVRVNAGTIELF